MAVLSCERATYNGREGWFVVHQEGATRDGTFYRDDGGATVAVIGDSNRKLLSLIESVGPQRAREKDLKTAHRHLSTVGAALLTDASSAQSAREEHDDVLAIAAHVLKMFAHNRGPKLGAVDKLSRAVDALRRDAGNADARAAYETAQRGADDAIAR